MHPVRLMTLDPGHFHAALVQKEMHPQVALQSHVYGRLGADLVAHLGRVAAFNERADRPSAWELEVHGGPDPLGRMLADRPGNVVILSGRNRGKIDKILAAAEAGLHVLADKPWVIDARDMPKLESALSAATVRGAIAYDIMTERYEITSILQRELVNDPETFGTIVPGTLAEPGVAMESVHYLMKMVAGAPNRRPPWFFDVEQQGEGLTDVGTHLVDLVPWILFPERPLDRRADIEVLAARRWPTIMTLADFQRVTGEERFPDYLAASVFGGRLDYYCNTLVSYTVRGIHARLNVLWDFEAAAGAGDTHLAVFRGTRSQVEVRQGAEQIYRPELFVVPVQAADSASVWGALEAKVDALQGTYPGLAVSEDGDRFRVSIPDTYRTGHEAHFAQVMNQFLRYVQAAESLPAWEAPNMLAKYHVTTMGVEMSRQHG